MAAGLLGLDDETTETAADFLGQPVPLAPKNQPALPVTGGPAVGAGAGPVAGAAPGAAPGATASAPGGPTPPGAVTPSALQAALKGGVKLADLANKIFPESGPASTSSSDTSPLSQVSGGELVLGAEPPPPALDPAAFAETTSMGSGAEALREGGQLATGTGAAGVTDTGLIADAFGTAAEALPFVGAAVDIGLTAAGGKTSPEQQGVNAALDVAAAALAAETLGLSEAALPFAKDQAAAVINLIEGKGEPWKNALSLAPGLSELETISKFFGVDLFDAFSHQGPYVPKRQAAGEEAGSDLSILGQDFQQAAQSFASSGDTAPVLSALQTTFGARNPVRSYLLLPPDMAGELGFTGDSGNTPTGRAFPSPDGQYYVDWGMLNQEQFTRVLERAHADPNFLTTAIQGSGDVAYLPQEQAQQAGDAAASQARQVLQFVLQGMDRPPAQAPSTPSPVEEAATVGGPSGPETTGAATPGGGGAEQALEVLYG